MQGISRTIITMLFCAAPVLAQHHHEQPMPADTSYAQREQMKHEQQTHPMEMPPEMDMGSTLMPTVPMQRDASGTSWLPDASVAYGIHKQAGGWSWMLHGTAFVRLTSQDAFGSGSRGKTTVSAPNWLMVTGQRRVAPSAEFGLRGMFSLDAATEGGRGYPLLFQTGESFQGEPLIDRQHPHDLFSELATSFGQGWGDGVGYFVYFGYPGEPALGPPAFMHRPSAQHNPDSPLSHHWQDATHITFGVATLGLRLGIFKLDGSIFNGREPDENRWDLDKAQFDSYSGRITANPSSHWAMQASGGYLTRPERLEPGVDLYRYTASVIYNGRVRGIGNWSNSVIWGMNNPVIKDTAGVGIADTRTLHSVLVESDLERLQWAYYTRVEWVQKTAHELGVADPGVQPYSIGSLTLGAARDVWRAGGLKAMAGVQSSFYAVPAGLRQEYGTFPVSLEVYLRISPNRIM